MNLYDLENSKPSRKKIAEAGYGQNRGYAQGFASPTAPGLGGVARSSEGESEYDDKMRKLTGMIFYNVNDTEMASALGLKQTRTGKWFLRTGNRNAQQAADRAFGAGKVWYPKNESADGISKEKETEFHSKLDTLVHDTFGKREGEVAEGEEMGTFAALKGLKTWQVVIMNNYYRGKYSDYSGRYYYVLATSPEEARQVVLDNADAILQELLAMKSHNGKKILPRGTAVRITPERINGVKDGTEAGRMSTAGFKKMFGPQGPMMVKLSGGAVVDMQDPVVQGSDLKTVAKADLGQNKLNLPSGYGDVVQPQKLEGVAEDSETEADIDKKIAFHQQGQAASQYKGSMNKMHAKKIKDLEAKKAALKKGVAEGLDGQRYSVVKNGKVTKSFDSVAKAKDYAAKFGGTIKDNNKQQGVAEGERVKTPSGMYRDQHTGVAYRGKTGQDGNDSYMTPDYLIQKYQERLAQIAAGPYKRPKEVAQLKSRIAKLQGQQGVAEGSQEDAFAAGHNAFHSGTTKNPYKPGSNESRQWDLGWETAQSRTWDKQGVAEQQVNEYLVKGGMPVKDVLALNLFQDFDPEEGCAAQFPEFAASRQWQQVVRKYAPIANTLEKQILALDQPLTHSAAEEIEEVWYDGSDAYDDMEIEYLVGIYNRQIATVEAVIAGELQDEEFDEARANTAGARAGLAKRKNAVPLSPEEQAAKDKAKSDKWLEKERAKMAAKTGVAENDFNHKPDDWSADFERRMSNNNNGFDTHIVLVTVSDPGATAVTQRGETVQKRARVRSSDKESAINTAIRHYKKAGYKVLDHHYVGAVRSGATPHNEDSGLNELSNELLGRYKKELGVRASAADKAGDYDKGHEYFKKINKATIRQGENDARKHEREEQNEMMETRLNMMRKAGYDL